MALPLLVFWQRHDVHVIDNSHPSDNYICICINSWEWWLCAWIQGSCMFFFSSWCSEYFLVMIHPPQKFYRETVSQHLLWVTQCLHWQAFSPPQLLAGKDRGLPLFWFLSFLFHFSGLPCSAQASCTFNISPSCFIQSKENQNQEQKI